MTVVRVSRRGSIAELGAILDRLSARRVFLVTGKSSFEASGARSALEPGIVGRAVTRFSDFAPNPIAQDVDRGAALLRESACDAVVAIGGGSVLDMAKLINVCAVHEGPAVEYLTAQRGLTTGGLPLVAVPTTAGSGAEATHFSTVYVCGEKYSLAHASMLPDHVILDHALTASAPASLTASAGIDALAQGIESYWSTRATEESRGYARDAIASAVGSLCAAVNDPSDTSRQNMLNASHLAGRAINIARTTAPHALSYALTIGFGVPHGHAVGLTLGAVFAYNAHIGTGAREDGAMEPARRRVDELCQLLGASDGDIARLQIDQLMRDIGLETQLSKLGVTRSDLPRLVGSVNAERLANNPRRLSPDAIGAILESIF